MPRKSAHPTWKPICREQHEAYELCRHSTITFLTGPAGCTKSFTAMAYAMNAMYEEEAETIYLTRPAVEACGEEFGFLPGDANEKMSVYTHPLIDVAKDYCKELYVDIRSNIQIVPLAYMRGITMKHGVAIMDEAQNATEPQMELFLSRIGKGTQIIICGDPFQSDIGKSPLLSIAADLSHIEGVSHYHFTSKASLARHPIIPKILNVFEGRKHGSKSGV